MEDIEQVERMQNLGASLVREYLFRMGLKNTLKCMDVEFPRTPGSFNNRILLARELKIEGMLYESKQNNYPGKSILEIMLVVFLNRSEYLEHKVPMPKRNVKNHKSFENWSKICQVVQESKYTSVHRSQVINIDRVTWFHRQLSDRGVKIDFQTLVHIYCHCFSSEYHSNLSRKTVGRPWSSGAFEGKVTANL